VVVKAKRFDYYVGIVNDSSALTNELRLREDNSDAIKILPELNCAFSSRLCVRVIATEIFSNISVAITQIHLMTVIVTVTVIVRTTFIPLSVIQIRNAAHMHNHGPSLQRLQEAQMNAARSGDHGKCES